ncbi:MAG: type II toxin-antitoxin system VapC family toxin [Anaerolineae bacterium]|nr:type II toxin-antitoxin system VapC family toxin [Anaerolineae bacterium]
MPDFLLDSCVLIRHLRHHQPTTELMIALAMDGRLGIATISRTEIIAGMRDHERQHTMHLIESLHAWPLDAAIADLAGDTIRQFRSQGIVLDKPDAIIGATAMHHNLVLVTYNAKHFPMEKLSLYPT